MHRILTVGLGARHGDNTLKSYYFDSNKYISILYKKYKRPENKNMCVGRFDYCLGVLHLPVFLSIIDWTAELTDAFCLSS